MLYNAVMPLRRLNQTVFSSALSMNETVFHSGQGISRQVGFRLEFPSPIWIAGQGLKFHQPFIGGPYVLFGFRLFVILVISRFGFDGGIWVLVAPVPGHCILVTFVSRPIQSFDGCLPRL